MAGYISEYDHYGAGIEFIELAIPTGTDVSGYSVVIYGSDGYLDHTINLSDLTVANTMFGTDVYVIEAGTPGFSGIDSGDSTAFLDDSGSVLQFVTHSSAVTAQDGPAAGETSTFIGTASGNLKSLQSDDGGASYYVTASTNPGTVPCYASGTLIDTPDGPRAVETLQVGDLVTTLDHGPQIIHWVNSSDQFLEVADVDAEPVLIVAGALGGKLPAQDLIVSPQHRILVGGHRQLQGQFAVEAFAAAKSLAALPGIRHMKGKRKITWVHFACDRHEVITANGCLSESLLLGPMVVNGLTAAERQAVVDIFGPAPTPDAALNGPPARECLKVGAVRRQLMKTLNEKAQRASMEIKRWDLDAAMERYEDERLREFNPMSQIGRERVA